MILTDWHHGIRTLIKPLLCLLGMLATTFAAGTVVYGQEASRSVTVGIHESPPFVMFDETGTPNGLAIDLWALLAEENALETDFVTFETFRELRDAVEIDAVDVAVTNVTITEDRIQRMDFTQPWFDAGLRIMVASEGTTGFRAIYNGLADAGHLRAYGWLLIVILIGTIVFTLFDRRFDKDFHPRWLDGIAHSFHTVMQIAVSGRMPARKNLFGWIGRIGQALWLVVGLAVVAYITSSVTSVMTTLAITETINGPDDLPGKRVGVFEGTIAQDFGEARGFDIRTFERVANAAQALVDGQIDALVADAPVLEYYAHLNPGMNLSVVGPIFAPDKYGFALPLDSELTKPLSIGLLALWEDGTIRALDTDYFGHEW